MKYFCDGSIKDILLLFLSLLFYFITTVLSPSEKEKESSAFILQKCEVKDYASEIFFDVNWIIVASNEL